MTAWRFILLCRYLKSVLPGKEFLLP